MALYQHRDLNDFRVKPILANGNVPTADVSRPSESLDFGGWSGDGYGGAMTSGGAVNGTTAQQAGGLLGQAGRASSLAGALSGSRSLSQFGGILSTAGGVIGAPSPEVAAARVGAAVAREAGVPSYVVGPLLSGVSTYSQTKDVEAAVRAGAVSLANTAAYSTPVVGPALAIVDFARALDGKKGLVDTYTTPVRDAVPAVSVEAILGKTKTTDEDETELGTVKDAATKAASPAAAVNVDISIAPTGGYSYGGWSDSDGNTVGVDANGAVTDSTVVDNFGGVGAATDSSPAPSVDESAGWGFGGDTGGWSGGDSAGSGAPGSDSDSNGGGGYGGGTGGVGD